MFILYDLVFLLISLVHLPVYLFRRKFHAGFLSRLGFLPEELKLNRPIWIHAVSVGEAVAIRGLIEKIKIAHPDKNLVISTVTSTGNKIAKSLASERDFVTYLPLDFSFIVKRVISSIQPSLFVIAETEIWPNLITFLYRRNVPIVLINGRISDKSFKGYRLLKPFLRPVLNKVSLFCVQTSTDKKRLLSLGVEENKIQVSGNMKFDNTLSFQEKAAFQAGPAAQLLKLGPQEKLLVAGSTHAQEEEGILAVYKNLRKEFPGLRLLFAPRHPERSANIEKLVLKSGFNPLLISNLSSDPDKLKPQAVFILDTIGQLLSFYILADVVFIGGSLVKKGGHNILEPAALGKPVIFGPYMFNFRDIANSFLKAKAAIMVEDFRGLEVNIRELLNDPLKVKRLCGQAMEIILQHSGATRKNLEYINNFIEQQPG
ncbi:MAG: hypothetical protein DRP74_00030 [Candidatus Omnitrophota bacterium]|mgnify:CR=1 FL=1|nr:MAG: hypothetical protein DRP74_00030 [Candidatus Omnitrophota bacterium]